MTTHYLETIRKKYPSRLTRAKAIKLHCKHGCCIGDTISWTECQNTLCFLWPFRLGKEVLGNQTSFKKSSKKHGQNTSFFGKKPIPGDNIESKGIVILETQEKFDSSDSLDPEEMVCPHCDRFVARFDKDGCEVCSHNEYGEENSCKLIFDDIPEVQSADNLQNNNLGVAK